MSLQNTLGFSLINIAVATAIGFTSITAGAANNEFKYLNGTMASSTHSELESRGYSKIHNELNNNQNQVIWWNAEQKDCVVTNEKFSKTTSIYDVSKSDCDPYITSKSSISPVVGLLAGAAAIAGIAAIANHNKHKQQDREKEARNNEEYDQGYNDGRNNYHRYGSHSDAYNNGYEAARNERNDSYNRYSDNGYNHHNNSFHNYGNNQRYIKVSDLNNIRASSGEQELIDRGFHEIDGNKGWRSSSVLWVNDDAQECVSVTTKDGRFQMPIVVGMNQCS